VGEVSGPRRCLKRVIGADGVYGFCVLPHGHEQLEGDARAPFCATPYVSKPPAPADFGPRRSK
jgi:hypothetical protein